MNCASRLRSLVLMLGLTSFPHIVAAAVQIDQQFVAPSSPSVTLVSVSSNQNWGQTFTTGISGYITQIDLQITRDPATFHPLNIELRKSGAQPDLSPAGLVYSTSIPAANVPTGPASTFTTTINLLGIPANAGDKFAILGFTDGQRYGWTSSTTSMYAGGTALWRPAANGADNFTVMSNYDSGFRTWISDVPEPACFSILLLAPLTLARRRITAS